MKKMKSFLSLSLALSSIAIFSSCQSDRIIATESPNDLSANALATTWDEGMPLGNAVVGSLIWQKKTICVFL